MVERERRKRNRSIRRKRELRRRVILFGVALLGVLIISLTIRGVAGLISNKKSQAAMDDKKVSFTGAPPIDVQLLTNNPYSRPGVALEKVNYIVVHYTANPGSTAKNNRDYFEGLGSSHETKASSHFVIGIEGEVIQCIPSSEISYASNKRNKDSLSIECCHLDESGEFSDATYQSLVELTAWLCERFGLTSKDVIRHYDVTEKICPKYFVDHEDSWEQFRVDVDTQIDVVKEKQKAEKE